MSVAGGWTEWSWQACSGSCTRGNQGTQVRIRNCTNPSPEDGGATCPGNHEEKYSCTLPCSRKCMVKECFVCSMFLQTITRRQYCSLGLVKCCAL